MEPVDITRYSREIKEAALAGYDTPKACADYLFGAKGLDAAVSEELVASLTRLMNSVEFNREFQRAKEDVIGTCLESFRSTAMKNVLQMKDMAENASDDRVKYSANKDILDRVGLAPTQKQVSYTPADYEKLVKGLREQEKASDGPESKPNGVVPKD